MSGRHEDDNTSATPTEPAACFTCDVVAEPVRPELIAQRTEHIIVNHYHPEPGEDERTGWFIVAPTRHVRRWYELAPDEQDELTRTISSLDQALTDILGARRCMIASLGWYTLDHLHVHVAPTTRSPITYGWENFSGERYQALGNNPEEVTAAVRQWLRRTATTPERKA